MYADDNNGVFPIGDLHPGVGGIAQDFDGNGYGTR